MEYDILNVVVVPKFSFCRWKGPLAKKVKSTTTREEVNALCMSQSLGCFKKVKEGVIVYY